MGIEVTDQDRTSMFSGLDIQIDFAMYENEKETKKKIQALKKGGKSLGGQLLKKVQTMPAVAPVMPKRELKPLEDMPHPDDEGNGMYP